MIEDKRAGIKYIEKGMREAWSATMFVFLCLFFLFIESDKVYGAEIPASEFEDEDLYNFVLDNYDTDGDGILTTEEAEAVQQIIINCNEDFTDMTLTNNIESFKGVEYFTNLIFLQIDYNAETQPLDISALANMTQLQSVSIYGHKNIIDITSLKDLTNLTSLSLNDSNVTDLSFLQNLTNIIHLSLGMCTRLTDGSPIANLSQLTYFSMDSTSMTDISFLSELDKLEYVYMQNTNVKDFKPLEKSSSTLKELYIGSYALSSPDYVTVENISFLSNCINLEKLALNSMTITDIPDLTGLTKLALLYLNDNYLSIKEVVTKLPVSITSQDNWLESVGLYNQRARDGDATGLNSGSANVTISSDIEVSVSGTFSEGTFLEALQLQDTGLLDSFKQMLGSSVQNIVDIWLFDITTYKFQYTDEQLQKIKSQPSDIATVTVTIPIDYNYEYCVFRQEKNGQLTKLDSYVSNGVLKFSTDHFSIFSIATSQLFENNSTDTTEQQTTNLNEIDEETTVTEDDEATDEYFNNNDDEKNGENGENKSTTLSSNIKRHIPDFVVIAIAIVGIGMYEIYRKFRNKQTG